MDENELKKLLNKKIDEVSFNSIKEDIIKFIPDVQGLDFWSPKYFHEPGR
jgi:hypothetical protein